ncbi:MAG: hypothetical protein H7281_04500 [Bacteriovorax sp.]|nr:hypothetical protein [Bacteriovorax sp.]
MNPTWTNGIAIKTIAINSGSSLLYFGLSKFPGTALSISRLVIFFELMGILLIFKKMRRWIIWLMIFFHFTLMIAMSLYELKIPYFLILFWIHSYDQKIKPEAIE